MVPLLPVQSNADELISLHRGQGMELFWRDNLACPTVDEYIVMVKHKTSGLLRLAVRLMQMYSSSNVYYALTGVSDSRDYVPLVNLIGILFQIRDDYQNLQNTQYHKNKGFCEDITEGKFSFPIIHSISSRPNDGQLISIPQIFKSMTLYILKQHTKSQDIKLRFVRYLRDETNSLAYTRAILGRLDAAARSEIGRLGGNSGLTALLDRLTLNEVEY